MAWGYEKAFIVEHVDFKKKLSCKDCCYYEKEDKSCLKRPLYLPEDGYNSWKNCKYFEPTKDAIKSKKDQIEKYLNKTNTVKLFTPAHFDLIIVDESHRSIFKKYRAIFEYFDAITVGLTATPKTDVDRNTYDFFEMENGVPTYAYDYETAVEEDHVLVPYYNYEVKTKFLDEGITYDDLSEEDKQRYEEDFAEDDYIPDFIPSEKLNKFVFNELTVDQVLQDLMERGIKVAGGDLLGKTIIFAQNKRHAEFILERFNKLYPQYKGTFAQRIICDDAYAQTVIDDFKVPDKEPRIAVSVDMMDTGIDVPECVNLVFFKKVRSKTKFWQMIGRGTRLAPDLECFDQIDGAYIGKRRFLIFDYCGNFEFFRTKPNGYEGKETKTLSENIFGKKIQIASSLQSASYADEPYQDWRKSIVSECHGQVERLRTDIISVKLKREFVEKYKKPEAFDSLSEGDKGELIDLIAPLVFMDDDDEYAKRFDNFMYGMPVFKLEARMFRDMYEGDLSINELVLPDTIIQPYRDLQNKMSIIVEQNIQVLTQEWKRDKIQENRDSISIVWKLFFALERVAEDPKRGPIYALTILKGAGRRNLIDLLIGSEEFISKHLRSLRDDMSIRLSAVKAARSAYLHAGLMQNRQRLFDTFMEAVAEYFTEDSRIIVLQKMQFMASIMRVRFNELYQGFFAPYWNVYSELIKTFRENYSAMSHDAEFMALNDS